MTNKMNINKKLERNLVLVLLFWAILLYVLSVTNFYLAFPPPIMGLSVFVILSILLSIFYKFNSFKRYLDGIPLRYLTLFHFGRVFAGLLFLTNVDLLPKDFALNAGYGDVIIGVLSCVTFVFFQSKWGYIFFNVFGLIDLIRALSLGLYFAISENEKMFTMNQLPFIYILLMGVPIWIFFHLISVLRIIKVYQNQSGLNF
jgi:hypothetical protein